MEIPFLDQPLVVISAYVHTGDAGDDNRMEEKLSFAAMTKRMETLRSSGAHVLLTGDFNVGHTELDIKNWKGNRNNAGFLESERAWFDRWFDDLGWVTSPGILLDRWKAPTHGGVSGQAFDRDVGWRIDYQIASPEFAAFAATSEVDRA